MTEKPMKSPSFLLALVPIAFLIILLSLNIWVFNADATGGANQIALLGAAALAALIGKRLGYTWKDLLGGIVNSIHSSLGAMLILLMIGALAGTWMISGIVPVMIYYGLEILHPSIFLVAACIVSAIISLATGSSWSTIATVGVALIGIGTALGLSTGMVAGAIISGAYFGDKMSPLSDTTNLAPAMAGTELFTHIRYMMYTTFPTFAITLIIFGILGFQAKDVAVDGSVPEMMAALESKFNLSPLLFLVPAAVIFMIVKKMDALPALFIGSILGGLFAIIFQPDIIKSLASEGESFAQAAYHVVVEAMANSTTVSTGNVRVDGLLESRGMAGMLNTIWLILCAMTLGGVLETTGVLRKLTSVIVKLAKSTGSLIASTAGTCLFFNATASDQYLAIVVPGRMFAETYKERGLAPENLSRTLEDSGTVTSVLIPWNTCGATQSTVLNVATGEYWMWCFFNLLSPVVTVAFGYLNFKIRKLEAPKAEA